MTNAELKFLEVVPNALRSIARTLGEINQKLDYLIQKEDELDRTETDRRDSSE